MSKSIAQHNKDLKDYRKSLGFYHFGGWVESESEAKRLSKKYKGPLLREQPKDYAVNE